MSEIYLKKQQSLSEEKYNQIIYEWNSTNKDYPKSKTVCQMFEEQANKIPSKIALIHNGHSLTYKELNEKSNQLARYIRQEYKIRTQQELLPDTLIALCIERSMEMIVGILAVLKAGGAYVPIDPSYPTERIQYILEDTKTKIVLSQRLFEKNNKQLSSEKIVYVDLTEKLYKETDTSNLPPKNRPQDLAYVIYTSGTTGTPKGVMIEHKAFSQFIYNFNGYLVEKINLIERNVLSLTNYVFDIFGLEYALPLSTGGIIRLSTLADIKENDFLDQQIIQQTPSTLLHIVNQFSHKLSSITCLVGGEALLTSIAEKLIKSFKDVINVYGPTETVIWSSAYHVKDANKVYIGKPLFNEQLYILNEHNTPVPVGVMGELFIGGAGLGRGYLNKPTLTSERFISNPFATDEEKLNGYTHLYKTGDLVRWLPDGNVEYIGRNDDQVKIQGHRIELGEVEHCLARIEGIDQACVLVKERKTEAETEKYLVGYYVLGNNHKQENEYKILNSWQNIHDLSYEQPVEASRLETDFSVWTSYITGHPIALSEMLAWRDTILDNIKELNPNHVLEIGVGSGLLMYPLLNSTQKYVGVDLSKTVISRHKKYLEAKNDNVELYHLRADQIDQLPENELFDTIIINSVCQYFPSIHYFNQILEKAINRLSENGSIFLGDIRNYDLSRSLITEKFEFENKSYTKKDIDRIALEENELLISPSYFINLKNKCHDLKVEILKRNGNYKNELSKYRYDVVISIDGRKKVEVQSLFVEKISKAILTNALIHNYNVPYLNQLSKAKIQEQLKKMLPEYMVPNVLISMESFPVTINGKLDKRELPEPEFDTLADTYVAPVTEAEIAMCSIWQEILGREHIGVEDEFFRLGGNSILAIQLSHLMSKSLSRDVKVADVFKHKTISKLLFHTINQTRTSIPVSTSKKSILSFAQERLWFIEQYEGGTNAYHIPLLYQLIENTDIEGLKYALQQIILRHEVLRSTIEQDNDLSCGVQIIHNDIFTIEDVQVSNNDYQSLIRKDINTPFDLSKEYPIRIKFYCIEPDSTGLSNRTLLMVNTHHIANDGWSIGIFESELFSYYESYIRKDFSFHFPPLEIQYKDYALWQKSFLAGDVLTKQINYWKQKLSGYQTLLFPTDYPRPHKVNYKGSKYDFSFNKAVSTELKKLAQTYGVSLHSVMLSGMNVLLSKYTGQEDIITGTPTANRHHNQTENLIGFFTNFQANRCILNSSQSFEELIYQVHQDQADAQSHQDLPFEKLINELKIERDESGHPIFQLTFEVQNSGDQQIIADKKKKYLKQVEIEDAYNVERFDISLFIDTTGEEIKGVINYAISLFHEDTIIRFINHYITLLSQLLHAPEKRYSQIDLFAVSDGLKFKTDPLVTTSIQQEREQLLEFNTILPTYDGQYRSVIDLFVAQAKQHPTATALYYQDVTLSYKELDERSDNLAHYLHKTYDVQPNTLVGILLERSDKLLVSILGILKAGCAYVPIDPSYPKGRKSHILTDAAITILLTQSDYRHDLDYYQGNIFEVDSKLDILERGNLPLGNVSGSDLAYVIYTSGTTGKPKGCCITQANLSHYIQWANSYYFNKESKGNFGLYTSLAFDLTITAIFCSLTRGNCLTIYPTHTELSEILKHSFSADSSIDSIKMTPSHIKLLDHLHLHSSTICCAIVGGEAMTMDHVRILKNINPEMRIFNEYGPTETTVGCMVESLELGKPVLIGKPIYGVSVYILGSQFELLPIGVVGEIFISGLGVGNGYLNNTALSDEKFIDNPFEPGNRMYRTGDLGRWLRDGRLEYKGRNDDQVKIRGYRIELGEIEHALTEIKGIKQSCVVAKDRKTDSGTIKYLVGYYVLDEEEEPLTDSLIQNNLGQVLPEYMVPSMLVEMESFPLTVNGKLDKRALPDPDFSLSETEFIAPRNETEKEICAIWQQLLGLTQVGITHDFFALGGNSILAIQVSHRMSNSLGYSIKVADIFKQKNIRSLLENSKMKKVSNKNVNWEISVDGL